MRTATLWLTSLSSATRTRASGRGRVLADAVAGDQGRAGPPGRPKITSQAVVQVGLVHRLHEVGGDPAARASRPVARVAEGREEDELDRLELGVGLHQAGAG